MNFTFENQGTNTYLVYTVKTDDNVDSLSLGMLTNNKIPGLATTLFTQMDTTKYIRFNVSAKISVKQFFSGPVNKKRLIGVFSGIVDAMLSAEDYMIDANTILLDLDYIFADVSTCETVLICLPVTQELQKNIDLGAFFKSIMFGTQFDQTENCDHVAKIINYLNSTPVFSLVDFKSLLDAMGENAVSVSQSQKPVQPPVVQTHAPVKATMPAPPFSPPPMQINGAARQPVAQTPPSPQYKPSPPAPAPAPRTAFVPQPQSSASGQQPSNEKKMSAFGLLMHYNKENAALYKSQKQERKMAGGYAQPPILQKPQNTPFAVPGAPAQNTQFAIPGQPVPPPGAPVRNVPKHIPVQPQQATPVISQAKQSAQPMARPATQHAQPQPQPQPVYQQQTFPQGQPMNFGETTVLGGKGIGETTVLGVTASDVQVKPQLIRAKNNEKINLDKPIFRIGKEKSYVDYFIGDNSAISRSHANIITREGEYYIVDTNSTNHTYLNGAMLQSNVETKLVHGSKISLANEDFEFKTY